MAMQNIPITMNEAWRDGLPVWILSLGAVFSGISVFLIVRSELASKRWGALRSAGLRDSVYWISWFLCFAMCGIVNSLLGGIVAVFLPVHVFQHVSFGVVFGLLLFLNLAIAAASFVLAAACGTVQSATLTVVVVIGMICAGAAPCMAIVFSRGYFDASDATNTYGFNWGDGGSFWVYASTERTQVEYLNFTYNSTTYQYDYGEPTLNQCEVPLLSFDQGRTMKTADERNNVPLEDVFTGCFVIPGASTTFLRDKGLFFFWYLLPQTHFTMAWSNILGFTGLPHSDNTFSLTQATKPPELLAAEALSNYLTSEGSVLLDPDTNGPSLFPEGSTALPEYYYWYDYYYDGPALNNCPSTEVIDNLCLGDYNWTSTSCYYTNSHYPSSSSPSVSNSIGYMASLVVIYLVMAFYIGAVFPMSNGAALKFYFPFQSGFWRRGRFLGDDEKNSSDDVETGIVLDGESKNAPEVGVEAVNVSKSYGKVEALKPFSIKLNVGEVTSLLGHNGAGKSTFVNMLCCEQNPSGGDIKVFGNSVKSSPHYVRSLLGECYQDDYLYPELSAQDHLELFAGIRGLASDKVESDVQLWLQSVDLELVKDNATSTFSGGMKRRLSVALSTIGPSKLIVLDEPTTGMDPISRRFVWDHITTIKPDRVILLTTHAMDEADLLSDEVVIVCDGKLVASGSPLELKHQYGSAVQLSIISGKQHAEEVSARIASHFATAQEWIDSSSSDSGYITLNIKKIKRISEDEGVEPSSLASFIGWIEGEDSPVQEFSLSNSSLEEVFLAVTKNHHPVNQSSNQEMISKGCCCCRKNKPQTVAEEVNTANVVSAADIGMHLENQPQATLSNFSRNLSVKMQTVALVRFYLKRNWSGRPSKVNWIVYGFFSIGNLCLGLGLAALWPYEAIYYFLLLTVFFLSMIMISLISPIYSDRNLGLQKMMEMQSLFRSSFLLGTSIYSLVVSFVYTFVVLTLFFATPIYR
jgi:ABC-type multidrug transport system ATPase subunit